MVKTEFHTKDLLNKAEMSQMAKGYMLAYLRDKWKCKTINHISSDSQIDIYIFCKNFFLNNAKNCAAYTRIPGKNYEKLGEDLYMTNACMGAGFGERDDKLYNELSKSARNLPRTNLREKNNTTLIWEVCNER